MSNVPAEISAYFSKIAKDASQNLSPEARHLRARTAADARWARVRAQTRIDSAADQIRSQHPQLSHAQAVSEALRRDPSLYTEYSAAHDQVSAATQPQFASEVREIEQVCALAGRPELAHIFVEQSVPAKAVIHFFLDQNKGGMFFRRKSIDAEIAGLERRREGLDQQLQELEAKLLTDHADTPPARRDALVDDFARLKSDITAKITATDSLLENLRAQKREQEAAAARLEAERNERELRDRRKAIAEQMITDAEVVDAAFAEAAAAAARLRDAANELGRSGVADTTRMVSRGVFTRSLRAAGLAHYADVEYTPGTIVQPLKEILHTHLARFH